MFYKTCIKFCSNLRLLYDCGYYLAMLIFPSIAHASNHPGHYTCTYVYRAVCMRSACHCAIVHATSDAKKSYSPRHPTEDTIIIRTGTIIAMLSIRTRAIVTCQCQLLHFCRCKLNTYFTTSSIDKSNLRNSLSYRPRDNTMLLLAFLVCLTWPGTEGERSESGIC